MDSNIDRDRTPGALRWPAQDGSACAPARGPAAAMARVPAPLYFSACFGMGAGLQHLLGLPLLPQAWAGTLHLAGTMLANGALLLVLASLVLFVRVRTTLLPGGSASRLVTAGPFRISRNPMYLSLVLAYAGLALMLDLPWTLAVLPAPVLVAHRVQIPFEEARMAGLFGQQYLNYRARVRRWL